MQYASSPTARRPTKQVKVGDLFIGSDAPVSVQGMTNVPTRLIDRCVAQIAAMQQQRCELVRVAVPTAEDTAALPEILKQTSAPVVADVHFHYARALEAIDAGVAKIRLNPGNIKNRREVEEVIAACKSNNTAIRVGVNQGSIRERRDQKIRDQESHRDTTTLMIEKLREYVRIFEDNNFDNLVLSAKCHDAARCISVNRTVAGEFDYPLHLGLTHAGDIRDGTIRSAAALGTLLAEGIGDTIRVSLAGDPLAEIDVAWEILHTLGLRQRWRPELIACPTCGRTEINLVDMVARVKQALAKIETPIKVAVMGCVVNGPGEAEEANVALCGGKDKAAIYRQGKLMATVQAEKAVDALTEQIRLFIQEGTK